MLTSSWTVFTLLSIIGLVFLYVWRHFEFEVSKSEMHTKHTINGNIQNAQLLRIMQSRHEYQTDVQSGGSQPGRTSPQWH